MESVSAGGRAILRTILPLGFRSGLIELIGTKPAIYFPAARLLQYERVVSASTDVVIEGYPRSSNSFACWAMEFANAGPLSIAHHRHVPAQIIRGVELGKPVLVLIRHPKDVCASQYIFMGGRISMAQILRGYCRFYETVRPSVDIGRGFEVGLFEQVTSDFGLVIERLNERFGSNFAKFEHTPENVEACFKLEEEYYIQRHGQVYERGIARPSEWRNAAKARLVHEYDKPKLAPLRERAEELFLNYVRLAGTQVAT